MKFKIPFTFSSVEKLRRRSKIFVPRVRKKTKLSDYLENAGVDLSREEYIGIGKRSFVISFMIVFLISGALLAFFQISYFYLIALLVGLMFAGFVFFSQLSYPRVFLERRQREIDKNLIPALEDMLVQLNSGIPLFGVLTNIAVGDYGELSSEIKKAVRRINASEQQVDVLNDIGEKNSSVYFRRVMWQISNGINAGSDLAVVVEHIIKSLNEEQMIQIQNYGNKLNPIVMFYMMVTVIIPALSITFLTLLSSMMGLDATFTRIVFIVLFVFIFLMQFLFLGMVKSRRPSLLR